MADDDFPFGANDPDDPFGEFPEGYPSDWDDVEGDDADDSIDGFPEPIDSDFELADDDPFGNMVLELNPESADWDGIPIDIALGVPERKHRARWLSVRKVYEARFTHYVLEQLWEAFWEKATSLKSIPDRFGIKWKPLKKRTILIKSELVREGEDIGISGNEASETRIPTPLVGRVGDRRRLSPRQFRRFQDRVKAEMKSVSRSTAERRAFREANLHNEVRERKSNDPEEPQLYTTPINVRFGDLVAQFFPGAVYKGRFYTGPDRDVGWRGEFGKDRHFVFEILIPYAKQVDAMRKLLPSSQEVQPLMREAHEAALPHAKERYLELKELLEEEK